MKLLEITIQNIEGVLAWHHVLDGKDITVRGFNGTGKTTIFNTITWIFLDKNSQGKSTFDLRPHTKAGVAIPGLTVMGEIKLLLDSGSKVTLKKENVERLNGGKVIGFTNNYYINDVGKSQGQFKEFLNNITPEGRLKMLVDLSYFNDDKKTHWSGRREIIMDFVGEIDTPEGYGSLLESAEPYRTYEDELPSVVLENYKKALKFIRNGDKDTKGYVGEQAEIPIQISENIRSLESFDEGDKPGLLSKRNKINTQIDSLGEDRKGIAESETKRQELIDKKNKLEVVKTVREGELKTDTSNIQKFIDEKAAFALVVSEQRLTVNKALGDIVEQCELIKTLENTLQSCLSRRSAIMIEHTELRAHDESSVCPMCEQALPNDKMIEIEQKKIEQLNKIAKRGKKEFENAKEAKRLVEKQKAALVDLQTAMDDGQATLQDLEHTRDETFLILDAKIAANETVKPEDDQTWVEINTKIHFIEKSIGDPVTEQLMNIDGQKHLQDELLKEVNDKLANFDTATKTRTRIKELSDRETVLGQKIAEIDGELKSIERYKTEQNRKIEEAVNNEFKYVTFRMFKENLNGSTEDACMAVYRETGTAYTDASTGEKIRMDIDVKNILSEHFGLDIFTFIDNAESLTFPVESNSQIIRLVADVDELKLKVE